MTATAAERLLRASLAFVWLATGALVLHPAYRAEGAAWLARMGVGPWLMVATCVGEVVFAGVVLARRTSLALAVAQTAPIAAFTVILAALDPWLLAHPLGVLSKNLPLVAMAWTAWLLAREGWSARAERLLAAGTAVVWITEGLFPKVLFPQPLEVGIIAWWGVSEATARTMIRVTGALQVASGVLALTLRGRPLRALLGAQLLALLVLPVVVTVPLPLLWVHPFGPLTKNVVILAGTYVRWRRCSSTSS